MLITSKSGLKIELPNDEEDAEITRQAIEDGTDHCDEELAQFKSFADSELPEVFKEALLKGHPKAERVAISIRLDGDVLSAFKATGKDWEGRINEALKEWLKEHAA